MKQLKEFIVNESNDVEFPDVLDSFKDWVGPTEAQNIYDEVFSEIFNVMDNGAETVEDVKKALIEAWK